jgi:hypothetical protein
LRDIGDGAGVRRHILASLAIAARDGMDHLTRLIAHREREPVNLGLCGKFNRRSLAQKTLHPRLEICDILREECIFERQHPDLMRDLAKAIAYLRPHTFAGAVAALGLGKARLDIGVAPLERIIIGI